MKFEQEKKRQFSKQDKSDKGDTDNAILPLIKKINSERDYYSTSSCAGRIVLIKDKEKKQEGLFLFRSHEKISFNELKGELNNAVKKYKGLIYFKQEACILHAACSSLQKAQELIDKAKFAGWKKSGIMASRRRIVCEMESTERLALPIADKGKILVENDYLKLLIKEANKKLARTGEKIKNLFRLID